MKNNTKLRNAYLSILEFIQKRFMADPLNKPSETERKFIDILKMIIEGGYSITEKDYKDILNNICDPNELSASEIEFFNTFLTIAKFKHSHSKFEQI